MMEMFFHIAPFVDKAIIVILLIFSVLVFGTSLERYFFLKPIYRKSRKTSLKIKEFIELGNLSEIESLAEDTSHPTGRAIALALSHLKTHEKKGLVKIFNAIYLQEKPNLEGSISILATIGSNAPFVGLLGTVFGIMRSFNDLSAMQEAGQQTVMAGISVALLATAMGLAVAIPSVILYNYFRKKVNRVLENLEYVREACLAYSESYQIKKQSTKGE